MTAREAPAAANVADGVWLVHTPAGIVSMTLDQLDVAFQRGDIDAETRVFTAGMSTWDTLGAVAGLDDTAQDDAAPAGVVGRAPHLELIEGGSFPPTSSATFGARGLDWAIASTPEQPVRTGVRRALTRVPFPLRRGVAMLLDALALSRRRLLAVGLCATGAAASVFFVASLYQLGSSSVKQSAHARSGWISARTVPAAVEDTPAATLPPPSEPRRAVTARQARSLESAAPVSAAITAVSSDDDIAVVRANELRLAPRVRSESRNSRAARVKAKARPRSSAAAQASRRASKRRRAPGE